MEKIILASQSPRRRDILTGMGLEFTVIPSNFDEKLDDARPVEEVAIELAIGKAADVAERNPDCYVIGSDTIVSINGKQLEKPIDTDDAHSMLRTLSGNRNEVTTSVAVINRTKDIQLVGVDVTHVYFKPYNEAAVSAYVASGDPMDKAGGYGIQSGAGVLIDHIEGEYDTVVGLPSKLLSELLAQVGIQSQPVHLEPPVAQTL